MADAFRSANPQRAAEQPSAGQDSVEPLVESGDTRTLDPATWTADARTRLVDFVRILLEWEAVRPHNRCQHARSRRPAARPVERAFTVVDGDPRKWLTILFARPGKP
jgi:hypothetical protein